jgi:hypothetical protein
VPHVLLGDQTIACAGCRATTCPVPGHPCISGIDPQEVVQAVGLLAAWGATTDGGTAQRPSNRTRLEETG